MLAVLTERRQFMQDVYIRYRPHIKAAERMRIIPNGGGGHAMTPALIAQRRRGLEQLRALETTITEELREGHVRLDGELPGYISGISFPRPPYPAPQDVPGRLEPFIVGQRPPEGAQERHVTLNQCSLRFYVVPTEVTCFVAGYDDLHAQVRFNSPYADVFATPGPEALYRRIDDLPVEQAIGDCECGGPGLAVCGSFLYSFGGEAVRGLLGDTDAQNGPTANTDEDDGTWYTHAFRFDLYTVAMGEGAGDVGVFPLVRKRSSSTRPVRCQLV